MPRGPTGPATGEASNGGRLRVLDRDRPGCSSRAKNDEEAMDRNEVIFLENHAAAQSLKNAWTRLASTYGCIMVVLSRGTLTIKPHWFAGWLISPLGLDLCHETPITKIRSVTEMGK